MKRFIMALIILLLGSIANAQEELIIGQCRNGELVNGGDFIIYQVHVNAGQNLVVTLDDIAGCPYYSDDLLELYIKYNAVPSRTDYDDKGDNLASDQEVSIINTQEGYYYIMVYGQALHCSPTRYNICVYDNTSANITIPLSQCMQGELDSGGALRVYQVHVNAGQNLVVTLDDIAGCPYYSDDLLELYIKYNAVPSRTDYDDKGDNLASDQEVSIINTQEGYYYIMVYAQWLNCTSTPYNICVYDNTSANITIPLSQCVQGELDSGGALRVYQVHVNAGQNLVVTLDDTDSNCPLAYADLLYLYIKYNSVPSITDYDDAGNNATPNQEVSIINTQEGYYYIMVYAQWLNCPPTSYCICANGSCEDYDNDGVSNVGDNCPQMPNGPNLGTCINIISGSATNTCINNGECVQGSFCSMNQEDRDHDGRGDACDGFNECKGNFDFDKDVDGTDAFVFKQHFGRGALINPCPPDGPAPVEKTWQTTSFSSGDDGDYQKGVIWPLTRFTDNGNGTVTDHLTGLVWLKNANCFGSNTWNNALVDVNGLADGACGLTDKSSAGDWRLPHYKELFSLVDAEYADPALPNAVGTGKWTEGDAFTNVQSNYYWSSTTASSLNTYAWLVSMLSSYVIMADKTNANYVWPVRGGR